MTDFETHIQAIVDRAPAPTPELKARLRVLLAPGVEAAYQARRARAASELRDAA